MTKCWQHQLVKINWMTLSQTTLYSNLDLCAQSKSQHSETTCSRCDTFNVQLAALRQQKGDDIAERIKQLETEKEEHHCAAQLARDSLVGDRHEAKDTSKLLTYKVHCPLLH